ncbi:hypothetical protein J6590_105402 [Homalodisca vitripennis]|nr:hypothetical protein J6590_105402 [Homalodisca vitripennis]
MAPSEPIDPIVNPPVQTEIVVQSSPSGRAEPDPPLLPVRLGSAQVSVRQCMAHYGSDSCTHHRKICSFRFHYCRPNVTHHSFRQG